MFQGYAPVLTKKISVITGNSSAAVKIEPARDRRLHGLLQEITFSSAPADLQAALARLTFTIFTGGTVQRRLVTGTELHDYMCLNGLNHSFELSGSVLTCYMPFAEHWFIDSIANGLAWNPAIVGTINMTVATNTGTISVVCWEDVSADLDAPSFGIITMEVIKPNAANALKFALGSGGQSEARGRLIQASIYDDTGGNAVVTASLKVGSDKIPAFEELTVAANNDRNGRFGLLSGTAAVASGAGRSDATIFDMVFVRGDSLNNAVDLTRGAIFEINSAASSGTRAILLARLEAN